MKYIVYCRKSTDEKERQVLSIQAQVAGLSTSIVSTSEESSSGTSNVPATFDSGATSEVLSQMTIESATVQLDLSVLGTLNAQGALVVVGPAEFKGETLFDKLVTFVSNVIFKGDVMFVGRPTFNKDTAGFALIQKGADKVEVTFEKEYTAIPIVTATINVSTTLSTGNQLTTDNTDEEVAARLLASDIRHIVMKTSTKGFTVKLNKPAPEDLRFSWSALAVKDPSTFSSGQVQKTVISSEFVVHSAEAGGVTPSPDVSPTPIPMQSSTPAPSPTPTVTPTPQPEADRPLDETPPTPNNEPITTITVNDNELGFLRVRSEPGTSSEELGQVLPGQTFTVSEESNGWYKIEYPSARSGQFGWVRGDYVTITP